MRPRLLIGVWAGVLLALGASLPSEGVPARAVSPERLLRGLVAIADLRPDPCPRGGAAGPRRPQVPADVCEVLKGETIPNGWAWAGFEDDNGWPVLSGGLGFDVRKDQQLKGRLTGLIEKLGYQPTTNTSDYDQAFYRKTADADFLLLLKVRERVREVRVIMDPRAPAETVAETVVEVGWRVRSAERWSLPTYCAGPARDAGPGRDKRPEERASPVSAEDPFSMSGFEGQQRAWDAGWGYCNRHPSSDAR